MGFLLVCVVWEEWGFGGVEEQDCRICLAGGAPGSWHISSDNRFNLLNIPLGDRLLGGCSVPIPRVPVFLFPFLGVLQKSLPRQRDFGLGLPERVSWFLKYFYFDLNGKYAWILFSWIVVLFAGRIFISLRFNVHFHSHAPRLSLCNLSSPSTPFPSLNPTRLFVRSLVGSVHSSLTKFVYTLGVCCGVAQGRLLYLPSPSVCPYVLPLSTPCGWHQ